MNPELTIDNEGNQFWILDHEYHRNNGPAISFVNGEKYWYLHGILISMTETGFKNYIIQQNVKSIL